MTPDPHFCYSMLTAPEKHVQGLSRAGHEQHRRLQPKRSIRDRLLRLSCRASANARGTGSESVSWQRGQYPNASALRQSIALGKDGGSGLCPRSLHNE